MKRELILCMLLAVIALCVPAAWAQTGTIKGYVHDVEGKPVVGANVQLVNKQNGRKYDIKTDKKGEYYSLGISSGTW